jgi:hypothetical protein
VINALSINLITLTLEVVAKVAGEFPFEAVLGKTRRTEF